MRIIKEDPKRPGEPLRREIDITPSWWRGETAFEDGADVLRVLGELADRNAMLSATCDVRVGVKAVVVTIVEYEDQQESELAEARTAVMAWIEAMAEGNERRTETSRQRAEFALEREERARRGQRAVTPTI